MRKLRSALSGAVFYLAMGLIGVLAVPAAVLIALTAGVYRLADRLSCALEGRERRQKRQSGDCKRLQNGVS